MSLHEADLPTVDPRWAGVRRLLAVRADALGDVLMTTPALRAIRHSLPGVHLTLLTSAAGAAAGPHLPEVDETLVLPLPWVKEFPAGSGPPQVLEGVEALRADAYDACVIFGNADQNPGPAALLAYLAGIPLRLAHSPTWLWHLLTDWVPDSDTAGPLRHGVQRELDLVASLGMRAPDGRLSFVVRPADRAEAHQALRAAGVDPARPYLVVHPGAASAKRRYDRYAEVVAGLTASTGHPVVVTGLASEADLAAEVAAASERAVSLAGRLGLGAFGAVVEGAALTVSNNTATSHVSAAVGTPVVVLYARTNPQHLPWDVAHRALYFDYPPCGSPCLHELCAAPVMPPRNVHPDLVVRAGREQLGIGGPWNSEDEPALSF